VVVKALARTIVRHASQLRPTGTAIGALPHPEQVKRRGTAHAEVDGRLDNGAGVVFRQTHGDAPNGRRRQVGRDLGPVQAGVGAAVKAIGSVAERIADGGVSDAGGTAVAGVVGIPSDDVAGGGAENVRPGRATVGGAVN